VQYIFAYAYDVKSNEEFYGKMKKNPIERVHNSGKALLKDLLEYSGDRVTEGK
jgi:hypothetical protein